MSQRYMFDPPADFKLADLAELFKVLRVEVDRSVYNEAPANVKRLFKPSIFEPSPSKMVN